MKRSVKAFVAASRNPSKHLRAFTLLELLVVIGILAVLLVAIVPAVNSLSKSSARKGGVNALLGAIEQAHATAMKDAQPTYLVFASQLPGNLDQAMVQRYSYRSYAIFQDDPANPGILKQLTNWNTLPTGVSIRSESLNYLATTKDFPFAPGGPTAQARFPFLMFNSNGEVDPSSTKTAVGTVDFGIFEGSVEGGSNRYTSRTQITENIKVSRLTGRGKYVP